MRSVRTKMLQQFPQLIAAPGNLCVNRSLLLLGDPSHALQLVIKDIILLPTNKEVFQAATFVADKFRNTRLKQFLIRHSGGNHNKRVSMFYQFQN